MFRLKVIENFSLRAFDELKNIKRAGANDEKGKLFVGDTFECDQKMVEYLIDKNPLKRPFATIIEVIPEDKKTEVKPRTKKTTISKKNIAKKD